MPELLKLEDIKVRWNELAMPAAWLLGTFGAVITFPVRIAQDGLDPRIVAGLLGILLSVAIAVLRSQPKRRPARSRRVMYLAALALLFVIAWQGYVLLLQVWTCDYFAGSRLVIGDAATPDLSAYLQRTNRPPSDAWDCRLVKEYAGDTLRMYSRGSLAVRYGLLLSTYLSLWLALASLVWASTELIHRGVPLNSKGKV